MREGGDRVITRRKGKMSNRGKRVKLWPHSIAYCGHKWCSVSQRDATLTPLYAPYAVLFGGSPIFKRVTWESVSRPYAIWRHFGANRWYRGVRPNPFLLIVAERVYALLWCTERVKICAGLKADLCRILHMPWHVLYPLPINCALAQRHTKKVGSCMIAQEPGKVKNEKNVSWVFAEAV